MWYSSVKEYYDMGFYTNDNVRVFVIANMITEEDYKNITGEDYVK